MKAYGANFIKAKLKYVSKNFNIFFVKALQYEQ